METLPTFSDLLVAAPVATITMLIAGIGWYARGKSADQTIGVMKEFIEFLKNRGNRKDD